MDITKAQGRECLKVAKRVAQYKKGVAQYKKGVPWDNLNATCTEALSQIGWCWDGVYFDWGRDDWNTQVVLALCMAATIAGVL